MFIKRNENRFQVESGKASDVVSNVNAGVYTIEIKKSFFGTRIFLQKTERYKNSNILDSGTFKEVKEHIEDFLSPEMYDIRKEMGHMNKLGLIFNGNPGTGKTYLAGQLAEKLADEKDALTIFSVGEPDLELASFIDTLREENPDRLVVVIIDEYEKRNKGGLDIMSFLDGGESRDNVIVIATVNSTSRLPDTILNRVGRIEKVYNFDKVDIEIVTKTVESVVPEKYKKHVDVKKFAKKILAGTEEDRRIDNIAVQIRNMIYSSLTGRSLRDIAKEKIKKPINIKLPKFPSRKERQKAKVKVLEKAVTKGINNSEVSKEW